MCRPGVVADHETAGRHSRRVTLDIEAGRRFADELGSLNQRLAAVSERVVLVVAGVAVPIKPEGTS